MIIIGACSNIWSAKIPRDVLLFSQILIDEWHDLIGDQAYGNVIRDHNIIAHLKAGRVDKEGWRSTATSAQDRKTAVLS